jgi:hypothetical protein
MDWNSLTPEEQEIISRYRQLTPSKKEAVLQSKSAFISWAKLALEKFWKKYGDTIMGQLIEGIFGFLTRTFL